MVSVLDDFEQIAAMIGAERGRAAVVDDQHLGLGQRSQQLGVASVAAGEFAEEPQQVQVQGAVAIAAGTVGERTGKPSLGVAEAAQGPGNELVRAGVFRGYESKWLAAFEEGTDLLHSLESLGLEGRDDHPPMIPDSDPLQAHFSLESRPPFGLMRYWKRLITMRSGACSWASMNKATNSASSASGCATIFL